MKTFIDTSPFIYIVENNPEFAEKARSYILESATNEEELITSVITLMEFGIMPERKGRNDLILQFEELLRLISCPVEVIDLDVAKKAYKLRAQYPFLRSMDALQIAVALQNDCGQFLTNDKKLRQITEIQVLIIEDLKS